MPSDFTNQLLEIWKQGRPQGFQAGGRPSPVFNTGGLGLKGTQVQSINKSEVDLTGVGALLERFGLLPRSRDQVLKLGDAWYQQWLERGPEASKQMLDEPHSQAMMHKFKKSGYPVVTGPDGKLTFTQTLGQELTPPEFRAWGQQPFGKYPPSEAAIAGGAVGDRFRINLGGFKTMKPESEIQQDLAQAEEAKRRGEAITANVGMAKELLPLQKQKVQAEIGSSNAYADYLRRQPFDKTDANQETASLKIVKDAANSTFKSQLESDKLIGKVVADTTLGQIDKASSFLQYGSSSLNHFASISRYGLPELSPYVDKCAQSFLHSGQMLASVPQSQMTGGMLTQGISPNWDSVLKRSYNDHKQFLNLKNEMGQYAASPAQTRAAVMNMLHLFEKMNIHEDVQGSVAELASILPLASNMGLAGEVYRVAKAKGIPPQQIDAIVQQMMQSVKQEKR